MMWDEDQILMEKWKTEEREKRLAAREAQQKAPIYQSTKGKRNIEGLSTFGHVQETEDVSKLMKNTIETGILPDKLKVDEEDDSLEDYFEKQGIDDKKFMKEVSRLTGSSKLAKEALALERLKREGKKNTQLTNKD